jgi:small GTP-binding protein
MSEMEEADGNKVIFLGESSVGKTNLIKVSIGQQFEADSITTWAPTYVSKEFVYNNKKYNFNLWDTIGQELYRSLSTIFFKNSDIVILVYDITNKKSFEELNYWYESAQKILGNDFMVGVIGNKSDLFTQEEVTEDEGKKYAEKIGAKFKLTSAKNEAANFTRFLEELFEDYIKKNSGSNLVRHRGLTIEPQKLEKRPKQKRGFC